MHHKHRRALRLVQKKIVKQSRIHKVMCGKLAERQIAR